MALYMYRQITSRAAHNEPAKKAAIESVLGPIPKARFRELKELCDDLYKNWIQAVVGETDKSDAKKNKNEPVAPAVTR